MCVRGCSDVAGIKVKWVMCSVNDVAAGTTLRRPLCRRSTSLHRSRSLGYQQFLGRIQLPVDGRINGFVRCSMAWVEFVAD